MNPLISALEIYRAQLHRLLSARANPGDADDLMQELYLKVAAVEDPAGVRDPASFVFRLAFNLASSWRRGAERRIRRDNAWMREGADLAGDVTVDLEPAADEALASRQELARVLLALRALPPRTQQVFEMHKLRGASYAEVATALGVSRSAIEKHMMRALAALSQARTR